ncbi:hypothetical protein K1719_046942 [Acacia pycnantha]|nr:hypothetical protein K1719_046942 [Acacia pycnantha]
MIDSTRKGRVLSEGSNDHNVDLVGPCHSIPSDLYDQSPSPLSKSPWSSHFHDASPFSASHMEDSSSSSVLLGSLIRQEGHIYSLAACNDLLYTGSDSKNIRVWKDHKEFSGFKANSGLVKAIVIAGERILTGHQDGKIRVWKVSGKDQNLYKRMTTMPTLRNYIKCAIKRSNYVETHDKRHRSKLWIKHYDAISCLGITEDCSLIYSASWDKTFKVWRASNYKCLESVTAHDDAVNALALGFDGLVFTGSADGTVKVWRRELQGKGTKHFFSSVLMKQESAITALAINQEGNVLYCGSSDGLVNYWEWDRNLSHGGVLRGHKLAVLCLTTAKILVFSGSADASICVWKRSLNGEHHCMSILNSHTGPVKCLAVEKDHEAMCNERRWILYSGSLDKSVKTWRVSEQSHVQQHQSRRSSTEVYPRSSSLRKLGSRRL